MPSISTCFISQLTALRRGCLICVNSIPQPCRTPQRSKCQDGGMRKIKGRAYVGSNGGEQQMEFTDRKKKKRPWRHYLFSAVCAPAHKKRCFLVDIFPVVRLVGMREELVAAAFVVCPQVCECVWLWEIIAACVCLQMHPSVFPCSASVKTSEVFTVRECLSRACGYWCVFRSLTYLSALTYSSSTGTQGTLPSLTPIWMSLNCRPRFSPRMVTLVPPWRGPVSGNNWINKRWRTEVRTDGEEEGWGIEKQQKRVQQRDKRTGRKGKTRQNKDNIQYFVQLWHKMYPQFHLLSENSLKICRSMDNSTETGMDKHENSQNRQPLADTKRHTHHTKLPISGDSSFNEEKSPPWHWKTIKMR